MKRLFPWTAVLTAVLALVARSPSASAREGGAGVGNGGDLTEIEIINVGQKLAKFLATEKGRGAFAEVDAAKFKSTVDAALIKVTTEIVRDYAGVQRSAINYEYEGKPVIRFHKASILKYEDKVDEQLVLIFHEYLNLAGLEKTNASAPAGAKPSSIYPISARAIPFREEILGTSLDDIKNGKFLKITCTNIMRPAGYKTFLYPDGTVRFNSQLYSPFGNGYRRVVLKTHFNGQYEAIQYKGGHEISVYFRETVKRGKKARHYQLDLVYRGKDRPGMGLIEYADRDFRTENPLDRHATVANTQPLRCVFWNQPEPPEN